jgi:hypothetical protein
MRYALAQKVRRATVARTLVLTFVAILSLGYLAATATAAPAEQDPFASAIAQIYTNPAAADDSLGRVQAFASGFPSISITLSSPAYSKGQRITVSEFRMKNPNAAAAVIEIKIWMELPGQNPVSILNVGSDGSFSFPPNFDQNVAPVTLFQNDGSYTPGSYYVSARVVDPVTGQIYSEDLNSFTLLP